LDHQKSIRSANGVALLLLAAGLTQMLGFLVGNPALRGIGAATQAAPLPKVFSAVDGYETFAADFYILYDVDGGSVRTPITPELYSRLAGPYNRRNAYGAALSYGPRLPSSLWRPVFQYGFRPGGPLYRELGIPEQARNVRVEIRSTTEGSRERWILNPGLAG
jgi:hypothetical protein